MGFPQERGLAGRGSHNSSSLECGFVCGPWRRGRPRGAGAQRSQHPLQASWVCLFPAGWPAAHILAPCHQPLRDLQLRLVPLPRAGRLEEEEEEEEEVPDWHTLAFKPANAFQLSRRGPAPTRLRGPQIPEAIPTPLHLATGLRVPLASCRLQVCLPFSDSPSFPYYRERHGGGGGGTAHTWQVRHCPRSPLCTLGRVVWGETRAQRPPEPSAEAATLVGRNQPAQPGLGCAPVVASSLPPARHHHPLCWGLLGPELATPWEGSARPSGRTQPAQADTAGTYGHGRGSAQLGCQGHKGC